MSSVEQMKEVIWRDSHTALVLLAISAALLIYVTYDGLAFMVYQWESLEEYSHGYLIPFISAFFLWQNFLRFLEKNSCSTTMI